MAQLPFPIAPLVGVVDGCAFFACDFLAVPCEGFVLLEPVSAELPVFAVGVDLPEDMPLLLPDVGEAPPCDEPVPPCAEPAPVPDVPLPPLDPPAPPEPPEPPPWACAMPIAPITARVAAIIRMPCFMSRPQLG